MDHLGIRSDIIFGGPGTIRLSRGIWIRYQDWPYYVMHNIYGSKLKIICAPLPYEPQVLGAFLKPGGEEGADLSPPSFGAVHDCRDLKRV